VPSSTSAGVAEQGPVAAFHLLEVPTHPLGTEGVLRPFQEVKYSDTSLRTNDAYMREGAYFGKCGNGRTGSCCSTSSPGGAHTPPRYRGGVEALPRGEMLQHKSQNQ
jgi:hypothetical protein